MHPLLSLESRPVFAHRGNSAHAPENTLEAFREAAALGVDGLELDVRITADDEVVVLHDPDVDRTTDGTGPVAALRMSDLRRFDAGARFTTDGGRTTPWKGRGVRVPLFEQVLTAFPDLPLLIEIKTAAASLRTREIIERHGAEDRCIVASFDHRALTPFRGSTIRTGSSRRDVLRLYLPARLGLPIPTPTFQVMCIPRTFRMVPLPVASLARALARHGVPVHIWTVDDPAVARRLWRDGVRGMISNDPRIILEARARS